MADAAGGDDAEVPIMTTLHFALQTQRSATIAESTGRSASFLQSSSMALVALGFIAPATEFGPSFYAFALLPLTALLGLGLVTFLRCVQLGVEDSLLARQVDEVKRFYLAKASSLAGRMKAPPAAGGDAGEAAVPVKVHGQTLLTTASLIGFVEATLFGAAAGLAAQVVAAPLLAAVVIGVAAALVAAAALLAVQRAMWQSQTD